MNENVKEFKSIDQVNLKTNQVLVKPIRPVFEPGIFRGKLKSLVSHLSLFVLLGVSIYLLLRNDPTMKAIGGLLIGIVSTYIVITLSRKK